MRFLQAWTFSEASLFNAKRLIARNASTQLFVGGLSYDTNETVLWDAFSQHGEIIEVKIICDRVSGKSKGFGFVRFAHESEASTARQEMDGQDVDGRNLRVHFANSSTK
ncbi:Glycine-rich RNA-binding protein 2, mitochondrial [Apostasia shenzhenica]|uniref:Glycine-rich RNA-binding protein 2, mitochondrial n=1 Tax=Apostasia shenzhenica TaxID=1088818 RepID=A0A2I0ALF2_9ASPA|nr:Glycine-rich RNA-binding protein 2, mitochondrial [Apostasia shenzhenica]